MPELDHVLRGTAAAFVLAVLAVAASDLPDNVLRGILAALALASLLLSASFFGTIWPERGWPIRIVCAGLFLVLAYGLAGQYKAFNRRIPFDETSWVGLIGYAVLVVGLVWFVHDRQTSRDG